MTARTLPRRRALLLAALCLSCQPRTRHVTTPAAPPPPADRSRGSTAAPPALPGVPPHGTVDRVTCPPVAIDHRRRTNHPGESALPVQLVVLGRVKPLKQRRDRFQVQIERILFGHTDQGTLELHHPWQIPAGKRIVALSDSPYRPPDPYQARYHLPASDEAAAAALGRARLDCYVLGAAAVFIGTEQRYLGDYRHELRVTEAIHGGGLRAGQLIRAELGGYIRHAGRQPTPRREPLIYLLSRTGGKQPGWSMITRLPVALAAEVRAALGRRTRHPVVPEDKGHAIEVMYAGTVAGAVDLLGAESRGARALAARYLLHRDAAGDVGARRAIEGAIDARLLAPGPAGDGRFRRLASLIPLLGELERRRRTGALKRRIARVLAHAAAGGEAPDTIKRRSTYYAPEVGRTDVNHALAWLCQAMERGALIRELGARLLEARTRARAGWRRELDLALESCRVRDTLELEATLKRTAGARSVRTGAAPLRHGSEDVDVVTFSPDGRLLATGVSGDGVKIWRVEGWSLQTRITAPAVDVLRFSRDSRQLFIAGGYRKPYAARHDVVSGRREVSYLGHEEGVSFLALTADERTLVTASYLDELLCVFDARTGKRRRRVKLRPHSFNLALDQATGRIARHIQEDQGGGIRIETPDGKQVASIPSHGMEANKLRFTPDGRHLVVTSFNFAGMTVTVHDVRRGYRQVGKRFIPGSLNRCTAIAVAPDSKRVVVGDQEGGLGVLSLPRLRRLTTLDLRRGTAVNNIDSIAFSPDGKRLVIAQSGRHVPHLYDAATLKPQEVAAAHGDRVEAVHFGDDRILTFSPDGTILRRDPATLGLLGRARMPAGTELVSVSPGGRHALLKRRRPTGSGFGVEPTPITVLETATGKIAGRLRLPLEYSGNDLLWLDDRRLVQVTKGLITHLAMPGGRIMRRVRYVPGSNYRSRLEPGTLTVEPGATVAWSVTGGARSSWFDAQSLDLTSGKRTRVGSRPLQSFTGNARGLVPGGKLLYVADPGYFVFERATLRPVAGRLTGQDLLSIDFSRDGKRVALVTGARIFVDAKLRFLDSGTRSIVRVHDARDGRTLYALPSPTRWSKVYISADGGKLLLVNDDGTLQLTTLPSS